jgi:hypothetical protein
MNESDGRLGDRDARRLARRKFHLDRSCVATPDATRVRPADVALSPPGETVR